MSGFTRLTVNGGRRRADVVVASDQPLASLMLRLLDLVDLDQDAGPYTLVRPIGDSLDLGEDCEGNQVEDGEILYVVAQSDTPAPPVVSDVTDVVAGVRAKLPGQWDDRARQVVCTVFVAVSAVLAGLFVPWGTMGELSRFFVLGAVMIAAIGAAIAVGRIGHRWGCIGLCAAAGGLSLPTGICFAALVSSSFSLVTVILASMLLLCVAVGAGAGIGLSYRPAAVSGIMSGAMMALGAVLVLTGVSTTRMCGVVAVVCVIVLGVIPGWALSASGLTGLDDFSSTGGQTGRDKVILTIAQAYRIVSWSSVAVTVTAGCAGFMLALGGGAWAIALAVIVGLLLALRTRTLPTALQAGVAWCCVLLVGASLAMGLPSWLRIICFALVGAVAAVLAANRFPDYVRIRLRRWADTLEKIALAATLPVLLGLFGVYGYLLRAF